MNRQEELAENLARVRARIAEACRKAARDPTSVTLVVVSKYFPASDVRCLAELGATDFGENRHPEAMLKRLACVDLDIRWHYIGGIQSNKAATIASYVDVVHSVDRSKLVPALERGVRDAKRSPLECLVQVSLDAPSTQGNRAGVAESDLAELAGTIQRSEYLSLRGLMAVAPREESPVSAFRRLAEIQAQFVRSFPGADVLSAGMSEDLEVAIAAGATHVRVGRSVLGLRPSFE